MKIETAEIVNYKGYLKQPISLDSGVNLLVGVNSSGKSSLLEALTFKFQNEPTSNLATKKTRTTALPAFSTVQVRLSLTGADLDEYAKNLGASSRQQFYLPQQIRNGSGIRPETVWESIVAQGLHAVATIPGNGQTPRLHRKAVEVQIQDFDSGPPRSAYLFISNEGIITAGGAVSSSEPHIVQRFLEENWHRFYLFKAERMGVGSSRQGTATELASDCRNLPECLDNLQANPHRFQRYLATVQRVLPEILGLAIVPAENTSEVSIKVWFHAPSSERADLAFDLAKCGTGVAQVLSICYVILTAEQDLVIAIDEPNSFLHPGATRKLMEIVRENPRHQYLISTHSPEVVRAFPAGRIFSVKAEGGESSISVVPGNVRDVNSVLEQVGAKLSDVFGYSSVLWVEGPTEAAAIPTIVDLLGVQVARSTAILPLRQTNHLTGKQAREAIQALNSMSTFSGLLPTQCAVVLDRENKTEQDLDRLRQEAQGLLRFLDRRMLENYFLDPEGLAYVINNTLAGTTTQAQTQAFLTQAEATNLHLDAAGHARIATGSSWTNETRADLVLADLFGQLTQTRLEYQKVRHGKQLAEWLTTNKPRSATELVSQFFPAPKIN